MKENLIGRYLKCIQKGAFCTNHDIGDVILLTSKSGDSTYKSSIKAKGNDWYWSYPDKDFSKNGFELMPEGFNPNSIDKFIDLLAKAKIRYPVGTKYYYIGDRSNQCTVKEEFKYHDITDNITDGNGGSVYCKGVWAEIIFTPVSLTSKQILELNDKSEFLSKKDLINGKYYNVSDGDTIWIIKYEDKNSFLCNFISYCNGFNYSGSRYKYKKASFSERQWLKACIKANKFIPKEEALKSNDKLGLNSDTFKVPLTMSNFDVSSTIKHSDGLYRTSDKIQDFANLLSHFNQKTALSYLTDIPKYLVDEQKQYNWDIMGKDVKFTDKNLGLKEYTVWSNKMSTERDHLWSMGIDPYDNKSNVLEFQQPVIIKNNNSKSKQLIIINQ